VNKADYVPFFRKVDNRREFVRLYRQGLDDYTIAAEMGVCRSTVQQHRARLGIPANGGTGWGGRRYNSTTRPKHKEADK
jgi:hypothetical protein